MNPALASVKNLIFFANRNSSKNNPTLDKKSYCVYGTLTVTRSTKYQLCSQVVGSFLRFGKLLPEFSKRLEKMFHRFSNNEIETNSRTRAHICSDERWNGYVVRGLTEKSERIIYLFSKSNMIRMKLSQTLLTVSVQIFLTLSRKFLPIIGVSYFSRNKLNTQHALLLGETHSPPPARRRRSW